jgi:signal transduction histidine kinase
MAIYEHAPVMMCVVDPDRRMLRVNRALAEFVGRPEEEIIDGRACGVLGCVRALDDPLGCGFGPHCTSCHLRLALEETHRTGTGRRGIEHRTTIVGPQAPRDVVLMGSTASIPGPQPLLLLCLEDVTERVRDLERLHASHQELRTLAGQLQTVREAERTRVAREIHDDLAQQLTRIKLDLAWLAGRVSKRSSNGALPARVADMGQVVDASIRTVQRIASELRPPVLDSLGLCAAVDWHVGDFQRRSGIACRLSLPVDEPPLSRDAATALYRIVQESLTNVLRHAEATRVDIALDVTGPDVRLRVRDNGRGAPPGALASPRSIGLVGMRERALLLGGHFEVLSEPGQGTAIEVRLQADGGGR